MFCLGVSKGFKNYCMKANVMNMPQLMKNAAMAGHLLQRKPNEDGLKARSREPHGKQFLAKSNVTARPFVDLIVSVLGILFGGKVLEPIWGSREFFKFVVLVNFWTLVSTFLLSITLYFATRQENYLYKPLSGFHGVLAGFLVSVKQLMPDQEVTILKLRAKWVPSIFVLFTTLLGALAVDAMSFLPFVIFGTYSSWLYLRFYQRHTDSNYKGDLSGEFSFATFFPEILRPIVNPICLICEKFFCGRLSRLESEGSGNILGGVPLPGSDAFDASRRRERGARALEERLNVAAKADSGVTLSAEENV
ncbi:hypothetical protein L7F22_024414 [Adiantum nelumboides]|nr:hypothetical protein [Adiantum nelumboides]